jgi:hypothetical protein
MKILVFVAAVAGALASAAQAGPLALHEIMCDDPSQVERYAEAAFGAGLSIDEARWAVNRAVGDPQACVFVPIVVENMHDEKQLKYNGQTYVIRRVDVVALFRQTEIGWISQAIAPRVQFSLAAKEKIRRMLPKRHVQ